MSKKYQLKPIAAALGTTFAVSLAMSPVLHAADNPFSMAEYQNGYMVAEGEGKCGEGKGEAEGKCGEGKGEAEGKCGEGKGEAEGKCGEGKEEAAEGKCGEGKCGEGK
jgi:uncharacterized low-complexity protein